MFLKEEFLRRDLHGNVPSDMESVEDRIMEGSTEEWEIENRETSLDISSDTTEVSRG